MHLWSKKYLLLIWKPFKVNKNGVFPFGISFFVLEMFTFLYYANYKSDDVIGGSTKTIQYSIINISRNIKQCSLNLATELYITKETKWHPSCRCHDNSYDTGPVLIKTKVPRFYLKQEWSTPTNLMRRVTTIWEPCVFWGRPSVPL